MKKVENTISVLIIGLLLVMVLLFSVMVKLIVDVVISVKTEKTEKETIELAKQDIISEYGFNTVLWLDCEKYDNLEDRDDFYIFTCLVEDDELYQYTFAVVIREVNGEIDVDTWRVY